MNTQRIVGNAMIIFFITLATTMLSGSPNTLVPTASAILTAIVAALTELKLDWDEKDKGIIYQSRLFTSKLLLL